MSLGKISILKLFSQHLVGQAGDHECRISQCQKKILILANGNEAPKTTTVFYTMDSHFVQKDGKKDINLFKLFCVRSSTNKFNSGDHMKKNISLTICFFICLSFFSSSTAASEQDDSLFQYATINGLLKGLYDGNMSFAELSTHGDLGLGTFNHLDGEMVALDGNFYQVKMDGTAYPVEPSCKTPFAVVTWFDINQHAVLPAGLNYQELQKELDKLITNHNHFYAFRIPVRLRSLTVRSVPAQKPPYHPLSEVVKEEAIFPYENVKGTLVGFYTPDYMKGLNVPGYHFHFLNSDRTRGGHVLALITESGTIEIDEVNEITMLLPDSRAFADTELAGDQKKALEKVEKR